MYFRYSSHCLLFSSKSLFLLLIFILVFQFPLICPASFTSVDSAFPAHSCPAAKLYPGVLRQQLPRIIPTLISRITAKPFWVLSGSLGSPWHATRCNMTASKSTKKECLANSFCRFLIPWRPSPNIWPTKSQTLVLKASDFMFAKIKPHALSCRI